jgi:hypothetical protein
LAAQQTTNKSLQLLHQQQQQRCSRFGKPRKSAWYAVLPCRNLICRARKQQQAALPETEPAVPDQVPLLKIQETGEPVDLT